MATCLNRVIASLNHFKFPQTRPDPTTKRRSDVCILRAAFSIRGAISFLPEATSCEFLTSSNIVEFQQRCCENGDLRFRDSPFYSNTRIQSNNHATHLTERSNPKCPRAKPHSLFIEARNGYSFIPAQKTGRQKS